LVKGMAQTLKIEDVIEEDTYVDRHGVIHPNKVGGKSIYFVNRVEDLFLDSITQHYGCAEQDKTDFLSAYAAINDLITDLPKGISKDSFRKNWIWNDRGEIVAIDFGTLRLLPPQFELVNLLEGCEDNLSDRDVIRLVERYTDVRKDIFGQAIDKTSFLAGYYPCAVQRHLELLGYNELGYLDIPLKIQNKNAENIWQVQKARYNLDKTTYLNHLLGQVSDPLDKFLARVEESILRQ
jgi:hypothetical protein